MIGGMGGMNFQFLARVDAAEGRHASPVISDSYKNIYLKPPNEVMV
jgi:hypothetical protein